MGLATDSLGNIYVTGETFGELDGKSFSGMVDYFIVKYNSSGIKQWTQLLGTNSGDNGGTVEITTDLNDHIYVTGYIYGSIENGNPNEYGHPDFFMKFDSNGKKIWTQQMNSSTSEVVPSDIATDFEGNIYLAGDIRYGELNGVPNVGGKDTFIAKFISQDISEEEDQKITGILSGTVVDEMGEPLAGVTVTAYGFTTTSNRDGNWTLTNLTVTDLVISTSTENENNNEVKVEGTIYTSFSKSGYPTFHSIYEEEIQVSSMSTDAFGNVVVEEIDVVIGYVELASLTRSFEGTIYDLKESTSDALKALQGTAEIQLIPSEVGKNSRGFYADYTSWFPGGAGFSGPACEYYFQEADGITGWVPVDVAGGIATVDSGRTSIADATVGGDPPSATDWTDNAALSTYVSGVQRPCLGQL